MSYPGGKDGAGVPQRIINQIPPHEIWICGFAGDCAVSRHIRPAEASILCDLDPAALRRWIPRRRPDTRLLNVDCLQWLRFAFDLDCFLEETPFCATAAADAENRDGRSRDAETRDARAVWRPGAVAFFRGLVPAAGDCGSSDAAGGHGRSTPSVFAYLDPPYLPETRSKKRIYRHEMSRSQHEALLRTILDLPCYCLVHGYPSPLYSEALQGWRTWTYRAMSRGGIVQEQCWANYSESVRLHDYRYVGSNKRERERIRRRVRNWTAGLTRAGTLERGAILQALGDVATAARSHDAESGGVSGKRSASRKPAPGAECPGYGRGGTANPCCERAGQYNGFDSGPLIFTCPNHCGCHD